MTPADRSSKHIYRRRRAMFVGWLLAVASPILLVVAFALLHSAIEAKGKNGFIWVGYAAAAVDLLIFPLVVVEAVRVLRLRVEVGAGWITAYNFNGKGMHQATSPEIESIDLMSKSFGASAYNVRVTGSAPAIPPDSQHCCSILELQYSSPTI